MLKNRRKSAYGNLDGNPLSVKHFQELDNSIDETELDELVELKILKKENDYLWVESRKVNSLTEVFYCFQESTLGLDFGPNISCHSDR